MPRHLVGLNDVIINLEITSKLPFGFTQLATQGDLRDKIRKPFCVKMGSVHVKRNVANISTITSNIIFPVSKSRHVSGIALKHDHKHAATAHARFSQKYLDGPIRGNLTMVQTGAIAPFPPGPHCQVKNGVFSRRRGCAERRPCSARELPWLLCAGATPRARSFPGPSGHQFNSKQGDTAVPSDKDRVAASPARPA